MGLKAARKRRRLTQVKLAAAAGVDAPTISRIEAGITKNPNNDTVVKLEAALKLTRGTLVFGDQVMTERAS